MSDQVPRLNDGTPNVIGSFQSIIVGGLPMDFQQSAANAINWTPVIGGSGGESGQTYNFQRGVYVKVGRLVVATFEVLLTAKGVITGSLQIKGLPFVGNSNLNQGYDLPGWENLVAGQLKLTARILANASVADLFRNSAVSVTSFGTAMVTGDINNNTALSGCFAYLTNT